MMKAKVNGQSKAVSPGDTKFPPEEAVFQNPFVSLLSYMTEKRNSLAKELKKLKDIENQIIKGKEGLFSKAEIESVNNIDQVSKCIELIDDFTRKTNEQASSYGKKVYSYKTSLKNKKSEEDIELLQNFMFYKSTITKLSGSNLQKYTDGLTSDLKITKEQVENCASLVNDFNCEKFTSSEEEFKVDTKISLEKAYRVITAYKKPVVGDVFGRKCKQILDDFAEKCNALEEQTSEIKSSETTLDEGIDTATETSNQVTPAPEQGFFHENNSVLDEQVPGDVQCNKEPSEEKEVENEDKCDKKSSESDETRSKENNFRKHNGGRRRWQNRNYNGERREGGFNNRDGTNDQKHFNRNRNDRIKRNDNENIEHRGDDNKKSNQHYKRPDGDYTRKPLRNGGENRGRFDGQKTYNNRPHYNNGFKNRGQNNKEQTSGSVNQNGINN
uniref:Caprin-1_dimer domain-containing protein n=1 Tax=Strongyloides papillosus TaxID=174720 RepID=A0A0N5B2K7_STREA